MRTILLHKDSWEGKETARALEGIYEVDRILQEVINEMGYSKTPGRITHGKQLSHELIKTLLGVDHYGSVPVKAVGKVYPPKPVVCELPRVRADVPVPITELALRVGACGT